MIYVFFCMFPAPEVQNQSICSILSDMFSLGMVICAIFNQGRAIIQANHSTSTYLKQLDVVSVRKEWFPVLSCLVLIFRFRFYIMFFYFVFRFLPCNSFVILTVWVILDVRTLGRLYVVMGLGRYRRTYRLPTTLSQLSLTFLFMFRNLRSFFYYRFLISLDCSPVSWNWQQPHFLHLCQRLLFIFECFAHCSIFPPSFQFEHVTLIVITKKNVFPRFFF